MEDIIKKAGVLIEALPYIKKFYDKTIVIKYGGAAMTDRTIRRAVLEDIVFMNYVGMQPVLVHGGGPFISKRIEELGREVKFVKGFRVTDEETMHVVENELMKINSDIVSEITALGGSALSLSGKEDRLIEVKKHPAIDGEDLGYVGEITKINADVIQKMVASDIIPVIAPIGIGEDEHAYNINADQVSAEVAGSLGALKLVVLTNVKGILKKLDDPSSLVQHASAAEVKELIASKIIGSGMIPKVNACVRALEHGVKKTHIVDVNIPHPLLLEIFTDTGIGTEIVA